MEALHLLQGMLTLLPFLGGVALSLFVSHRRAEAYFRREGRALRLALAGELNILMGSYEFNLQQLDAGAATLPSCRQLTAVYRQTAGRLHLLGEDTIAAVVNAYTFTEALEACLTAVCRPQGGCYLVLWGESPVELVRSMYLDGHARMQLARDALARPRRSRWRAIPRLGRTHPVDRAAPTGERGAYPEGRAN